MNDQACQCVLPDNAVKLFCERHRCFKYRRKVELCAAGAQGVPFARDYWRAWEEGRSPDQRPPEPRPRVTEITLGPGTELKKLFVAIGIIGCRRGIECADLLQRMNEWGVAGCREHHAEIVCELRTRQHDYGWVDKIKAAALSLKTGLAFSIDWRDPFPGIVDEAIRRAEAISVSPGPA